MSTMSTMSTVFDSFTQQNCNKLNHEQITKILWMLTETGKFQDIDWGNPLDASNPDQVQAWCESMGAVYDPDLTGPKMMARVRKSRTVAEKPVTNTTVVTKQIAQKKPTVSELKAQCKDLGIKGFSKMKKTELEAAIATGSATKTHPVEDHPVATQDPVEDPVATQDPVDDDDEDEDLELDQNGEYIGFVWPDVDDETE